jgi:cellulose synthase operon protein C
LTVRNIVALILSGAILAFLQAAPAPAQSINDDDRLSFADGLFSRGLYDLAAREYEAFLGKSPSHPKADSAHFRLGESLRRQKDYRAAEKKFKYVFEHYPNSEFRLKAGFRRADLFMELGQFDAAAELFDTVLKQNPPPDVAAASLYFRAVALQKLGRDPEAVQILEDLRVRYTSSEYSAYAMLSLGELYGGGVTRLVEAKPDKALAYFKAVAAKPLTPRVGAEALFQLGDLYFRQKTYDKSAEMFRSLLSTYPDDPRSAESRMNAAWSSLNAGLYAEALQMATSALAAGGVNSGTGTATKTDEWLYLEANCERQLSRSDDALKTYDSLLKSFPTSQYANAARYEKVLTLYRMKSYLQAVGEAAQVDLSSGFRKDIYWLLGESYAALQDTDKAIQYYRLLVRDFADSDVARDATYRLAYYLQTRKEYAEAARYYLLTATRYPDSDLAPAALFASGTCRALSSEHTDAIRDWSQLLQKYPASPQAEEALFQKAMSEVRLKRDTDAVASLDQILRRNAKSAFAADAWFWKGMIATEQKNMQDAEAAMRQALLAAPRTDLVHEIEFHLAGILQKAGKTEEAAGLYQRLVASPSKSKLTPAVLEWLSEYWNDRKDHSQASAAARQLTAYPDPAWQQTGWGLLGQAQLANGDRTAALESFRKAVETKANTRFAAEAYLHLGEMKLQGNETQPALELLRQAAARATGDNLIEVRARAYAGLGRAAKAAGSTDEAVRYFMSVAVLYDDAKLVPECMYEAVQGLKTLGKAAEAAKVQAELLQRYPTSEWAIRAAN